MLHTSPAERRRETAANRILDATLELVRHRGIGALTMQEIATATDYTAGALYRYFPGKGALLAALVRRELIQLHRELDEALVPLDAPLPRLVAIGAALRALVSQRPATSMLIRATLADPVRHVTDDEAVHIESFQRLMLAVAAEVASATAAGVLTPGDPVARTLRWVFGALGIQQLDKIVSFDARLDPDPLVAELNRDLLVAWGVDPLALETP